MAIRSQCLVNEWLPVHLPSRQRLCRMSMFKDLKDAQDGYKYFVGHLYPEEWKAAYTMYKDEIAELKLKNKDKDPKDQTPWRMSGTQLIVRNVPRKQYLTAPSPKKFFKTLMENKDALDTLPVAISKVQRSKGSAFRGVAIKATNMETVQLAYVKAHLLMPEATHIMVAYKVAGNGGQVDDREHFGSEQLKKLLEGENRRNTALFMARKYGGTHLGKDRYNLINHVGTEALLKLDQNQPDANVDPGE